MTTGMPEIGSKISLISKADIRYEGRLFTVDPTECTIALSSVRSFGTEDREAQFPVPAQSQMYDYILFRGSDIKDIQVLNNVAHGNPPLNDPAIMQLSVPPSLGQHHFQSHPVVGALAPGPMSNLVHYGNYSMGGMPGAFPGPLSTKPSELLIPAAEQPPVQPPPILSPNEPSAPPQAPNRSNDHASVLDLISGGGRSRSTTPASLGSRKSPTNDQSVQAGGSGKRDDKNKKPVPPNQNKNPRRNSREGRDFREHHPQDLQQRNQNNRQPNQQNRNHNQGYHNQGHPGGYNNYNQGHMQGYRNQDGGYRNNPEGGFRNNQDGGYRNNQNQVRGGWEPRGPMRPRGRPRGGFNPKQQGQPTPNTKKPLKFDKDYDFEEANTQFENLRTQLVKLKVEDTSSTASTNKSEVTTNGDVEKKDDSGNETGAGETEVEDEHEVFYDKAKSFFDKISCEAVERAKGKSQRTDWRQERKLNTETFGVAAARRGNFRGRGGFNRGMGFRGGFRGGYNRPYNNQQNQRRDSQPSQDQAAAK